MVVDTAKGGGLSGANQAYSHGDQCAHYAHRAHRRDEQRHQGPAELVHAGHSKLARQRI
ncbi:hypothetical protein ACOJBO_03800 [Rhizobium beringeri]